jgi:branched-chain amino acid transport system permease protein
MDWGSIFRNGGQAAFGPVACYTALAAIGLNIQFGYTGLLNFGQAAFAAAGAYGIAVAVTTFGLSFWLGVFIGMFAAVLLALLLGFPTLRLRADYLAIVTIAASEIVRLTVRSVRFTPTFGGTDGLQGFTNRFFDISPLHGGQYGFWIFKYSRDDAWVSIVGWTVVALCCLMTYLLIRSPWGRIVKGIREDEDAVRSLGKNTYWYKMQSLILGGIFGAFSGMVFALSKHSVNPDDYATKFTFTALAVLILGGTARVLGPVVGAIIFTGALQFIDVFTREAISNGYLPGWLIDDSKVAIVRLVFVGLSIVLLMIFRPQGIFGDKREALIRDR